MKRDIVQFGINVELIDGSRCVWSSDRFETMNAAATSWSLDKIQQREPMVCKIIVVEFRERDLFVSEQQIEGVLATPPLAPPAPVQP